MCFICAARWVIYVCSYAMLVPRFTIQSSVHIKINAVPAKRKEKQVWKCNQTESGAKMGKTGENSSIVTTNTHFGQHIKMSQKQRNKISKKRKNYNKIKNKRRAQHKPDECHSCLANPVSPPLALILSSFRPLSLANGHRQRQRLSLRPRRRPCRKPRQPTQKGVKALAKTRGIHAHTQTHPDTHTQAQT